MREKTDHPAWLLTPGGEPRGYIESESLTELWFHTGTNCNLSCPFCLEGSKPGDNRIQFITLEEARSFIDEAIGLDPRLRLMIDHIFGAVLPPLFGLQFCGRTNRVVTDATVTPLAS